MADPELSSEKKEMFAQEMLHSNYVWGLITLINHKAEQERKRGK